ncbi:hypothetical protein OE88DRAFT_1071874 [Heliocybe sulcata]|uniref:Uncharacterized protein n=1 Tax=Heliocybe sulcata TaxID=5364 RepID=A0A5C3MKU5_9AGAM|nr:hypothetical protein OE88DRAFT_1071874 [Heliocybe sulcata]
MNGSISRWVPTESPWHCPNCVTVQVDGVYPWHELKHLVPDGNREQIVFAVVNCEVIDACQHRCQMLSNLLDAGAVRPIAEVYFDERCVCRAGGVIEETPRQVDATVASELCCYARACSCHAIHKRVTRSLFSLGVMDTASRRSRQLSSMH